ncbi:hypothetical protein PPYR_14994 [Photinus pyralis]|nr:hypothetical protein PPYR_14994 [Photinus pyralis]
MIFPSPEPWESEGLRNVSDYTDLVLQYWKENVDNTPLDVPDERNETVTRKKTNKNSKISNDKLRSPCKTNCRRRCRERVSENERRKVFEYFNKLEFSNKQLLLDKYIQKKEVKYRKVDAEKNKKFTVSYTLPTFKEENNSSDSIVAESSSRCGPIVVCKEMFLRTLGKKSDGMITCFLQRTANDLPNLQDKRGAAHARKMKEVASENYNVIKNHIETYHPQVSHYNISHAPHRRYLPPDLSIHQMHKDFSSKIKTVSYETYRKVFEKENIGFSAPTQDDCGLCAVYKQHAHKTDDPTTETSSQEEKEQIDPNVSSNAKSDCDTCEKYQLHKKRYTIARQMYTKDSSGGFDNDTEIYAVDMQKVLLLPKMSTKDSFFVSRLVVFHETFANLKSKGYNKCILWHEAIMGRNAADVASAYYNVVTKLQNETKHLIFWCDNCTSQNKNWTLFTACITFVNQDWGPESITFKYFEPGHSFMKADSIHGQIGKKWSKSKEILDMEDLEKLMKSANKLNEVTTLRFDDFRKFENGCMQKKKTNCMPKLNDIKSVLFKKGSTKIFYKCELEHEEFQEATVLKPKFKPQIPEKQGADRGINTKKKEAISKVLLPSMPSRKQMFWQNLPNFDDKEDLGKSNAEFVV